jgi:hypothetical protein
VVAEHAGDDRGGGLEDELAGWRRCDRSEPGCREFGEPARDSGGTEPPGSPPREQAAGVAVGRGDDVRAVAGEREQQVRERRWDRDGRVAEPKEDLAADLRDVVVIGAGWPTAATSRAGRRLLPPYNLRVQGRDHANGWCRCRLHYIDAYVATPIAADRPKPTPTDYSWAGRGPNRSIAAASWRRTSLANWTTARICHPRVRDPPPLTLRKGRRRQRG